MRKKWFIVVILILIPLLISCKQTIPSNETTNNTTENKTIENPSTATTPQTTPSTSETIHTEPTTPSTSQTINTEPTDSEEPSMPPVFEPPVYVPTDGIEIIEDPLWWDTPYLEIYSVERYAFDYFLDNPSIDTLYAIYMEKYQDAPSYQTYSFFKFFDIETTLFRFVKDKEKITNFLAENGINMTVEYAMLIDTPYIPMLLWVRGGGENAFITIKDITEYDDEYEFVGITYEYECYTVTAFRDKFGVQYGSLNIHGKEFPNTTVRIYEDIASDLPLLRVLEAYGAMIDRESEHLFIITFHEKQFKLDLKREILYEVGDKTEFDLLFPLGGPLIVYPTEYDMMVDTHTLTFALNEMGQKTTNIEDRTNKVVIIKNRDE